MNKVVMRISSMVLILLFLLLSSPAILAASPAIGNITATPPAFNSDTGSTTISYTLTDVTEGQVVLEIYDQTNILVRMMDAGIQYSGTHTITWDGKNQDGAPVSEVIYTAKLCVAVGGEELYSFVLKWGSYGNSDGQFYYPADLALDTSGNIYVADALNCRIQKFSPDGTFLAKWGTQGVGDGQFNKPESVAVDDSGNVYVTEGANNRIQKFSADGTFLTKWGTYGAGDGQFKFPIDIAVDPSGNIYVVDLNNNRIQKFSSDGTFLTKWGTYGLGDGQFRWPVGIGVDASGDVYVADTQNNRIQKFDSDGTFLAKWGTYGSDEGQFKLPEGIGLDNSGNVYVADKYNFRIQKFDADGAFITKWGTQGTGDGQFSTLRGIAVDTTENVYIADFYNNRIQKFAPSTFPQTITAQTNILVDNTPPVITYSGNEGAYFVDQVVNITCSANDTLSGIATSTCQNITGPAYSFSLGLNTFTATARDNAGNAGSGSTSFTVQVTYESLGNLVNCFVTERGIAKSLSTKIDNAQKAEASGNDEAKAGIIGAFINQVEAQTGKAISIEDAGTLIALAEAL